MKKIVNLIVTIGTLLLLPSCDSTMYYENNVDMPKETWHRDSILSFDVAIDDTLSAFNIIFNNRITGQYEYSNMFLFVKITTPDNICQFDTLECILADERGKWLGKGFGDVWTNNVYYKKNILFPRKGEYNFTIEQAMRIEELQHVLDAGIRIERVN